MKGKSIYTESLGRSVANRAKESVPGKYRVVPLTGKWIVVQNGSVKPVKRFFLLEEAIEFAKQRAASYPSGEVVIHDKNGMVEMRIYT